MLPWSTMLTEVWSASNRPLDRVVPRGLESPLPCGRVPCFFAASSLMQSPFFSASMQEWAAGVDGVGLQALPAAFEGLHFPSLESPGPGPPPDRGAS